MTIGTDLDAALAALDARIAVLETPTAPPPPPDPSSIEWFDSDGGVLVSGALVRPAIRGWDPTAAPVEGAGVTFYHNGTLNRTDTTGPPGSVFQMHPAITVAEGDVLRAEWAAGESEFTVPLA